MANPHRTNFIEGNDATLMGQLHEDFIYDNGISVFYLPKDQVLIDCIMNEDIVSKFAEVVEIDIFIESSSSEFIAPSAIFEFGGFGFGKESTTVHFSRSRSEALIGHLPREGDLVFIRELEKLLELTSVDKRNPFIDGGNHFTVSAQLTPYQPAEGTQHFSDEVKDLARSIELLTGAVNPVELLVNAGLSMDSTVITLDHNWHLLGSPAASPFTFDNSYLAPTTISITLDSTAYTFDSDVLSMDSNLSINEALDDAIDALQEELLPADNNKIESQDTSKFIKTSNRNPFGFF